MEYLDTVRENIIPNENTYPIKVGSIASVIRVSESEEELLSDISNISINSLRIDLSGTISNIKYNQYHPFLKPQMTANFLSDDCLEDIEFCPQDMYFRDLNIDYKLLTTGEPTVTEKNFRRFPKQFRPLTFDYGYCITCHKAQGSEYDKVLVLEEFLKGSDHDRWLYTAATRAKEKLVVVRNFR